MDRLDKYPGSIVSPLRTRVVTMVRGAARTPFQRKMAMTSAILLSALIISSSLLLAHPFSVYGTAVAPGSLPSWNPAVACTALLTTIEGVIGNQANSNGGATYAGGDSCRAFPTRDQLLLPVRLMETRLLSRSIGSSFPLATR